MQYCNKQYRRLYKIMNRCEKLYKAMKEASLDAVIITDRANVRYFSGFKGSAGYLVITLSQKLLVTDFRYIEQAQLQAKDFKICDVTDFDMADVVSDHMNAGFEDVSILYSQYSSLSSKVKNLVPMGTMLTDIRAVKDSEETEYISQAAAIADRAFEHIISYIRKGMTERQVALELEMYMKKCGAEGLSFDSIVATGARGSLPHAEPGDNVICDGDLVVLDYGCVVNGYCSDMTRTVAVGDISEKQLQVYNDVLRVQKECLEMVRPGARCSEIHEYSSKVLNGIYKDCYGHGLGHGVGLEIHERPNLNSRNQGLLVPGNVITVEPGVYISGFCGVRIEDLVLVTEDGYRILSNSTKELVKIQ